MYLSSIFLIMLILAGCGTRLALSETLFPPKNVPFKKDVLVDRYSDNKALQRFKYSGEWKIKEVGNQAHITGVALDKQIWLMSKDKLTKGPKSLKIDFSARNKHGDYGFVLGDYGVLVSGNKLYTAEFDERTSQLTIKSSQPVIAINENQNMFSIFNINTGYDPTGEMELGCNMYINGRGISINCPSGDAPFGVYVGPQNSITLRNIRWDIGSL